MNFSEEITTFRKVRYETKVIQIVDTYCSSTDLSRDLLIAPLLSDGWTIAGVAGGGSATQVNPQYGGQSVITSVWLIVLEREIDEGPPEPKPVEGTTVG